MTQPQPAPLVDLDELQRQLSADVHAEDYECPRCECMTTGDNESESVFCQDCAYDVAENVVPLLLQELRALRIMRAKVHGLAFETLDYGGSFAAGLREIERLSR